MNIYVGNLALETTEDELRQEFIAFGQVVSVSIMNDRYIGSGQSKGYGFVEMPLDSEAKAAIAALSGRILRLRSIDVIQALPLSSKRDNTRYSEGSGRFSARVRQRRI